MKITKKFYVYSRLYLLAMLAVLGFYLAIRCFEKPWISAAALFNIGVDVLGSFICISLYYGCIGEEKLGLEESAYWMLGLVFQIALSIFNNELIWLLNGLPENKGWILFLNELGMVYEFGLIMLFYNYVRRTLDFKGKLAEWMNKYVFILVIPFVVMTFANSFVPINFFVDEQGFLQTMPLYHLKDLYEVFVLSVATVLFVRCDAQFRQKMAAFSFVAIPIAHAIVSKGAHGYATRYGSMLFAVTYVYAAIFSTRNKKLARTAAELDTAGRIQTSMLPNIFPAFPDRKEFEIYAMMDPAREVGGDFYDFFMIDPDHLCLVMADVSGKGVPGAMFMMISKIILQSTAILKKSPAEVLEIANAAICASNKEGMFVTVWIGILEISTGKMKAANAGHEYPIYMKKDHPYELIKDKHGLVIGAFGDAKYPEYEFTMEAGDKLFVYTDGVPEAMDKNNNQFGIKRLVEALNIVRSGDPVQTLKFVKTTVEAFVKEADQFDDLTMMCIKYNGISSNTSLQKFIDDLNG